MYSCTVLHAFSFAEILRKGEMFDKMKKINNWDSELYIVMFACPVFRSVSTAAQIEPE